MLLISLFSGPCPWSGQLWSFSVAVTCPVLWLRRYLTVLSLLYGRCWISLIFSLPFRLVLFLCRLLAFTGRSAPLARSPLPLCFRFGRAVMLDAGLISVSSYLWDALSSLAILCSHFRFAVFPVRHCVMTESWPIRVCILP